MGRFLVTVYGDLGLAAEQSRLDLLGEEALALHRTEGAILDQIALRLEDDEFRLSAMNPANGVADPVGLP